MDYNTRLCTLFQSFVKSTRSETAKEDLREKVLSLVADIYKDLCDAIGVSHPGYVQLEFGEYLGKENCNCIILKLHTTGRMLIKIEDIIDQSRHTLLQIFASIHYMIDDLSRGQVSLANLSSVSGTFMFAYK